MYTTGDGREVLIKQTMRYESATQINRIEWHYFINEEFHSTENLDMRLFFPQELDSYLEQAGFNIIHKFGGFEEELFDGKSGKQIYVLSPSCFVGNNDDLYSNSVNKLQASEMTIIKNRHYYGYKIHNSHKRELR